MRYLCSLLALISLSGCHSDSNVDGNPSDSGIADAADTSDPDTAVVDGSPDVASDTSSEPDGDTSSDATRNADASDAVDAYSDFQRTTNCQTEKNQKKLLVLSKATHEPEKTPGCALVPLAKNGDEQPFDLTTPEKWAYAGAMVYDQECHNYFVFDEQGMAAEHASGTIEVTEDDEGNPVEMNYDVLLEFPEGESNPYGRHVRLQGRDAPSSMCPGD